MRCWFFLRSFVGWIFVSIVLAADRVTPYTPECERFRLRVNQKETYRTVGYVTFNGVDAVVTTASSDAFHFALGKSAANKGILFSGNRRSLGTPLGSQIQKGYGQLQRYSESAHKLGYHRSWSVGPEDYLHLQNTLIDFTNDRARFCYNSGKQLFARLSEKSSKQPHFTCTPVSFYAQCGELDSRRSRETQANIELVDTPPPNPSSDAEPELKPRASLETEWAAMEDASPAPEPISWLVKRQDYWRA